jgi:Arc/MetJ family transcription regulator
VQKISSKGEKMRATVTIEKDRLDLLIKETKTKTKASAVRIAIDEYLKKRQIQKIMAQKGKLEFDRSADEIRHYER